MFNVLMGKGEGLKKNIILILLILKNCFVIFKYLYKVRIVNGFLSFIEC